jgi:hypothetical protein
VGRPVARARSSGREGGGIGPAPDGAFCAPGPPALLTLPIMAARRRHGPAVVRPLQRADSAAVAHLGRG